MFILLKENNFVTSWVSIKITNNIRNIIYSLIQNEYEVNPCPDVIQGGHKRVQMMH